ncbi:MAG: hypothetical protein R3201_00120 [Oceanisphaera sp.]|nr:hypothetical protein [Oceanisphaera sp.]
MKPYIITTGANGRAVIYGYSETEPIPGQPYRLERARMVIYWTEHGLLGLAADGPQSGARISKVVEFTSGEVVRQVLSVSAAAAVAMDEVKPWQG